jgi:DNA-binding NarL/FixJ family response regulator
MTLPPPAECLRAPLGDLLALERAIDAFAGQQRTHLPLGSPVREILAEMETLARTHIEAICTRLQGQTPPAATAPDGVFQPAAPRGHSGFEVLREAYAIVQRAIISYSVIQPVAHRTRDSWVIADDGTTSHIARRHTQEYVRVAGRIVAVIHDVVIAEMDADGAVCRCTCPACSIGVCMCALTGRAILAEASLAARPPLAEHGVELKPPRPGSAADAAAFLRGDVIVAVNGEPVDTLPAFQRMIRDHDPSAPIAFTVRRTAGDVTVLVEPRREGADLNEDECVLGSGQQFYLAQAADVRRRLRRRGMPREHGTGFASLSPREVQVLRLLVHGATNPIIADELEISRPTVATHVANVLRKLGLVNRTEAAGLAAREGLFSDV